MTPREVTISGKARAVTQTRLRGHNATPLPTVIGLFTTTIARHSAYQLNCYNGKACYKPIYDYGYVMYCIYLPRVFMRNAGIIFTRSH